MPLPRSQARQRHYEPALTAVIASSPMRWFGRAVGNRLSIEAIVDLSTGTEKGASFRNRKVLHLAGRELCRREGWCGGFSRSEP